MTHPADIAADRIDQRIRTLRGQINSVLRPLEPLEAVALLGYLTAETINRFPPAERATVLKALCDELQAPDPNA